MPRQPARESIPCFFRGCGGGESVSEAGEAVAGEHAIDSVLIPRVHPQVIEAINMSTYPEETGAVGVMEFFSITAAVYAADAAAKAADVTSLIDVRLGTGIGGKSFVVLTGEVAAVNEAVRCGIATGEEKGPRYNERCYTEPRPEIFTALM